MTSLTLCLVPEPTTYWGDDSTSNHVFDPITVNKPIIGGMLVTDCTEDFTDNSDAGAMVWWIPDADGNITTGQVLAYTNHSGTADVQTGHMMLTTASSYFPSTTTRGVIIPGSGYIKVEAGGTGGWGIGSSASYASFRGIWLVLLFAD